MGERTNKRKYESANQISVFQNLARKRESLTERKHFQGLKRNFGWKKTAEIWKNFKLSLTAGELKQILFFKSFVIKQAKYCFIIFF